MIPWEVGSDPRLSAEDVRVYFALAASRRGVDVTMGMRLIAKACCRGYRKIGKSVVRLQKYGHIEATAGTRGQRMRYRLTSALFVSKVEPNVDPSESPNLSAEAVKLVCPKCHTRCKGLLRVGWCRSCNWKVKVRRIVREEIAAAS